MKITSLMKLAGKCKTAKDAESLLDKMREAFGKLRIVERLREANSESYMEDGKAFVRFELNYVLSDHYIIMIRPEIRGGEFTVALDTNHMLDGLGMSSQSWDTDEDLQDTLTFDEDMTVAAVAKAAAIRAIQFHAELLKRVGVNPDAALVAAKKSW